MKRGIAFVLGLFLLSFVSAQFFSDYGSYGSFSITGFFDSIGSQDIILLTSFIIIFAFLFFALSRINLFKTTKMTPYGRVDEPNKAIPGVISFAISLLAVYGIYRSDFDLEGLFSGFGISTEIFYPLMWVILVAAAVFIIWAFGRRKYGGFSLSGGLAGLFFTLGLGIILTVFFTDFFYEKGTALVIGAGLLIVSLFLWRWARKKMMQGTGMLRQNYDWQREKREFKWSILILGALVTVFGFLINQIIVIIIGLALVVIGLWRIIRSPRAPITDPRRLLPPGRF
ncbi:MAG: hypothetical protein Q8P79_02650 [Nanoarchaeota archaeon]|nr:hypothetical protein [Nanoarchaeota archaeon]